MAVAASEARRVFYSGRVQGVGFRYTAHRIAHGYAVTGYVKNLRDGRVELFAEGASGELDRLLNEIAATMAGNIEDTEVRKESAAGKYNSFAVTY